MTITTTQARQPLSARAPWPGGQHTERNLDHHVEDLLGGYCSNPCGIEHWFKDMDHLDVFTSRFSGKGIPDRIVTFIRPTWRLSFAAFVRGQLGCYPTRAAWNFSVGVEELPRMRAWTALTGQPAMLVFGGWKDDFFLASPDQVEQLGELNCHSETGSQFYRINAMAEMLTPLDNVAKYGLLPYIPPQLAA